MPIRKGLLNRANLYAQHNGLMLGEQLGSGVHGIVLVVKSKNKLRPTAIKVHEREDAYGRERDVYLRLLDRGVRNIRGFHVPRLLQYDNDLWVIEMEIVSRPFVLDFAGAYLDAPPDYPQEVIDEWRIEKQEQFDTQWSDVEVILSSLQRYGVYMVDVNPGNIAFPKH